MADLIPEGCIALVDAYDYYHAKIWNGHDVFATLYNINFYVEGFPHSGKKNRERHEKVNAIEGTYFSDLLQPFSDGTLELLVRPEGSSENFIIPISVWDQVFYPERFLLVREIGPGHGGYWEDLAGRIPFIRKQPFLEWLDAQGETSAQAMLREYLIAAEAEGIIPSSRIKPVMRDWGGSDSSILVQTPDTETALFQKGTTGRKEADYWKPARAALIAEILLRGPISPNQPDWNAKARYEDFMRSYIKTKYDDEDEPTSSTIKRHVKKALRLLAEQQENSSA